MKRRNLLLSAIGMGSTLLLLLLPLSVSQGNEMASGPATVKQSTVITAVHLASRNKTVLTSNQPFDPAQGGQPYLAKRTNPATLVATAIPIPIDPLATISQDDITPRHKELARHVLQLLPDWCQARLQNFHVLYNRPDFRGSAGRGVIIMNGTLSDEQFVTLILHEGVGHFWDLTCVDGTKDTAKSSFKDGDIAIPANDPSVSFYQISWTEEHKKKSTARTDEFVSHYATSDAFEDLAESVVYYLLQEDAFRTRAQTNAVIAQKLAWLDLYFPTHDPVATGSAWTGKMPADAAKGVFVLR